MFDIQEIDVRDPRIFESVHALQIAAFGTFEESLVHHILIDSHERSTAFAAYDGNRMVGVNGFMGHDIAIDGRTSIAFQSCMSATDPSYGGKGIFSGIINRAKEALASRGGAFIFGYPNSNSGPIFAKKLGFTVQDLAVVHLPLIAPRVLTRMFHDAERHAREMAQPGIVRFDARKTAEWKKTHPTKEVVKAIDFYTNFIFGRTSIQRLGGISVKVCKVGGYEINKPPLLPESLAALAQSSGAHAARFVMPTNAPLAVASRFARIGRRTEPLITYPLNMDLKNCIVDAWTGLKDVY